MRERILLALILGVDALVLFYQVSTLSITANEASTLYEGHSFIQYIINYSLLLFGQNDYALRTPMIIFHLLSAILLYGVSKSYVKRNSDRLWVVLVFVLLPGVISSALLVNSAGIVIFTLFLLLYLYQKKSSLIPLFLILLIGIDGAYALLYLAIFVYAFKKNNVFYMLLSIILLAGMFYFYTFDTTGKPSGHFLDVLGLYATIFSPVIFIYIVYTLYRKMISKEYDILLYIGGVVFVVSMVLSFRQNIQIESFAPYLMLLLPLTAQTFFSSYRVRLRQFRGRYRILLSMGFATLAFHFLLLLFNPFLYLVLEDPKRNFAYKAHIVKELAGELHTNNINCVSAESDNLQLRLRFYGITECETHVLYEVPKDIDSDVTISYVGRKVASFNVTKSPI